MEENLHKDNLEEFFKNSFDNENIEPSDDQWDVPSDSVWTGINEKINPVAPIVSAASSFKLKWIIAAAASVLFIGLVYYNYTLQKQVAELKELVERQENIIKDLKDDGKVEHGNQSESREPQTTNQSNLTNEGQISSNNKKETSNKNPDKSGFETSGKASTTGKLHNDFNPNESQKILPEQQNNETKHAFESVQPNNPPAENSDKKKAIASDDLIIETSSIAITTDVSKTDRPQADELKVEEQNQKNTAPFSSVSPTGFTEVLMPLPSKLILAEVNAKSEELAFEPLPLSETAFDAPKTSMATPGFYVGAHIAPTYSYRNITSVNGPVLRRLLNEKEQAFYSVALGLKGGYQFSKNWSVETGLNYYKNTIQSTHRAQIRYEGQIERLNSDGNYDSNYQLKLSTSYGEIETDVALTRNSDTQIGQNDYINLVLKTRQELKYLGVPIAVRYRTAGNKFHFSAKAGISGNFILQKDVAIKAAQVNRTGVHHRRIIVDKKFEGLKNTTFDFLLGMGIDYDISKKMSIYFEPTVTHSINPVYSLNGKIKTYPIVASLNIGLMYKF